jgi:hypothetical protein
VHESHPIRAEPLAFESCFVGEVSVACTVKPPVIGISRPSHGSNV